MMREHLSRVLGEKPQKIRTPSATALLPVADFDDPAHQIDAEFAGLEDRLLSLCCEPVANAARMRATISFMPNGLVT